MRQITLVFSGKEDGVEVGKEVEVGLVTAYSISHNLILNHEEVLLV